MGKKKKKRRMKVGWKRQKAFDEYGVSGMKFLIIKNTCITRRIYRLFVCFFFHRYLQLQFS